MLFKIFRRALIGILTLLLAILILDFALGRVVVDPEVADKILEIDAKRLKLHVEYLSRIGSRFQKVERTSGIRPESSVSAEIQVINQNLRPYGLSLTDGNHREKKLRYIEQELLKLGLKSHRQNFQTSKVGDGINLICEMGSRKETTKFIDVTAHYDSFADSPGADDNNSGVAGVLEIARIVSTYPDIKRNVRLVFFDFEELGLVGSKAYLDKIVTENQQRPELCINLEMIGYFTDLPNTQTSPARIPIIFEPPTTGNTIITVGNFNSYTYGRKVDGTFKAYTELPIFSVSRWGDLLGNASRSDHFSYWQAGIPAIMLTDSANFRNPNYHKETDQPDTLDYPRMKSVTEGAAAFVLSWASQ